MRSISHVLALVTLATVSSLGVAGACPPGPCTKYRMPRVEEVQLYHRVVATPIPARLDRRALERFLVGSVWTPVPGMAGPPYTLGSPMPIRFASPAEASRRPIAERTVLIRQLEWRDKLAYVEVDGAFYALVECREGRARSGCLRRVGALPPEPTPPPPHRFATPPP
jgi:hypothetical protein